MTSAVEIKFETLRITNNANGVVHVELMRNPVNAMNNKFFEEILHCFRSLSYNPNARCVVLSADGRMFTAGLDLKEAASTFPNGDDAARAGLRFRPHIHWLQESFKAIESCSVPVIAAIHGGCIGGGLDLITACDIRICSSDAYFTVAEVDVGIVADLGTLQRMPKVMGNDSLVRDLCFTGRKLEAREALSFGLVSAVHKTKVELMAAANEMAASIAAKSPVVVAGIKETLNYGREHNTDEGLRQTAMLNMLLLQSQDLAESVGARMQKRPPIYSKL